MLPCLLVFSFRNLFTYLFILIFTLYWSRVHEQASLVAQLVKNLPAMQETLVQFLGQEDPLEKGEATCSSIPGGSDSKEST